jgi:purine-binding chemotaxis protein CheW
MTQPEEVPEAAEPDGMGVSEESVLVVRLGETEFGLPIRDVREVLRAPPISRVPFPPPDVTGLIGVRGAVLPVLDLGLRLFRRPARTPGAIVIAQEPESLESIALLVDRVTGLVEGSAPKDRRDAPVEAEATLPPGWVASVRIPEPGRPITVLNLRAVLPNPEPRGPDDADPRTPSDSEP